MTNLNEYILWTAIITPMHEDGSTDYESFARTLRTQEAAQNGILVLGSTGESLNIDTSEKEKIVDFVMEQKLSVPIMVGVGGSVLQTQIDWIKHLNTLNVSAILMAVPQYAKPDTHGQYGWFKALLDASNVPCMIYNIPSRTGKPLSFDALKMMSGHPNFWAIKESSASTDEFKKYSEAAPNAHMLSGDDIMLNDFARLGAKGVVSVAANPWPVATHEFSRQALEDTLNEVDEWKAWAKTLFSASNPVPTKALMAHKGDISTPIVHLPLSDKDMPEISIVTDADAAVCSWLEEQQN